MLKKAAFALLALVMAIMLLAVIDLDLTDKLKERYVRESVKDTGVINLVAAIYLDYRAYDTLGEILVLFAAVVGMIFILRKD
jgi:multisubunit Na+/H+ antiporter MnhB subunit